MNLKTVIVSMFFALLTMAAYSESLVSGPMGSRTAVKAYVDADGGGDAQTILVKDIAFPLKIYEISDSGFIRVKISEKDVWLDRRQVKVPADKLEATCLTVDRVNAGLVSGGIRGANAGCK